MASSYSSSSLLQDTRCISITRRKLKKEKKRQDLSNKLRRAILRKLKSQQQLRRNQALLPEERNPSKHAVHLAPKLPHNKRLKKLTTIWYSNLKKAALKRRKSATRILLLDNLCKPILISLPYPI